MTPQTAETIKTSTIGDCFTLPADEFLRKAHADLGFDDQLVALCLWVHRDRPLSEIEQHAEASHVPFQALVGGLHHLFEAKLWTMHPVRLGAALEGHWIDDSALQQLTEIVDALRRGECACGECFTNSDAQNEVVH